MLNVDSPILLGDVKVNSPHVFTVKVENVDNTDINILELFVGCQSCTTVAMPRRVVHGLETVDLTATFTPRTLGNQEKSITIRYREGNTESRHVIVFRATVKP